MLQVVPSASVHIMMTSTIRYMLYAVHHRVIPARVIKEDLVLAFVGYSKVNTLFP